jgi:hypothetical protein
MNRRLIVFLILILIVIAIGVGLVLAVRKQNQPPQSGTIQLKKLLDDQLVSPVGSFDHNSIWYFNSAGHLFAVKADGTGLTEFPLPALNSGTVREVLWPQVGTDFILLINSNSKIGKLFYSSAQKVYATLPDNIQSLDWLPDGKRILYIWQSSDNVHQQLVMANADGTGFTPIDSVFWPDLQVKASPDGKTALLYRSKTQGDTNKIYSVDLTTKQITTVIDQGNNVDAEWLPQSNRFVFAQSDANSSYPKLFLYDAVNKQTTDLKLSTSLDKITFDDNGQNLYAAIQQKSGDVFLKEDLSNFKQSTFFDPGSTSVSAKNLLLLGETLYFTNVKDSKFYSIGK